MTSACMIATTHKCWATWKTTSFSHRIERFEMKSISWSLCASTVVDAATAATTMTERTREQRHTRQKRSIAPWLDLSASASWEGEGETQASKEEAIKRISKAAPRSEQDQESQAIIQRGRRRACTETKRHMMKVCLCVLVSHALSHWPRYSAHDPLLESMGLCLMSEPLVCSVSISLFVSSRRRATAATTRGGTDKQHLTTQATTTERVWIGENDTGEVDSTPPRRSQETIHTTPRCTITSHGEEEEEKEEEEKEKKDLMVLFSLSQSYHLIILSSLNVNEYMINLISWSKMYHHHHHHHHHKEEEEEEEEGSTLRSIMIRWDQDRWLERSTR